MPPLSSALLLAALGTVRAAEVVWANVSEPSLEPLKMRHPRSADSRRLEPPAEAVHSVCRSVAQRLLPAPSLSAFHTCMDEKRAHGSSHDWAVPSAEVAAQVECWCANNLTETIEDYHCCQHPDFWPMCTIDCTPNCSTPHAQDCVDRCSPMCFEADEYIVDREDCIYCDWEACWPVLSCITDHAEQQVETGDLDRICHHVNFSAGEELRNYQQCWQDAPKHSSHWNILSSMVHCICREDMKSLVLESSCCESVLYGGGVCNVECLSEADCNTPDAQTCIHSCQLHCPANDLVPSRDCMQQCLSSYSPCHRYKSCRPPSHPGHVCDDGRWPEGSTGCCVSSLTGRLRCPTLCETQRIWRLDAPSSVPVWLRQHGGAGIIAQCTCGGCPTSDLEANMTIAQAVEGALWDNGQVLLVDIARREGLDLGPNRQMQELMAQRNDEIIQASQDYGPLPNEVTEAKIIEINDRYTSLITAAAHEYPDDDYQTQADDSSSKTDRVITRLPFVVVACTLLIVCSIAVSTICLIKRRTAVSNRVIQLSQESPEVVIGNPVAPGSSGPHGVPIHMGSPVYHLQTEGSKQTADSKMATMPATAQTARLLMGPSQWATSHTSTAYSQPRGDVDAQPTGMDSEPLA